MKSNKKQGMLLQKKKKNMSIGQQLTGEVIWTDGSSFEIGKLSPQPRVWRNASEKFKKECLAPTFKSGRTSIMVWDAIADGMKSKLVFMKKGMRTSADFINQVYEPVLLDGGRQRA
ncbi:hypothetical protein RMATCC62417_10869 [Rhizopus microsporus]|nr:hypothetical protein RMATCC62417_10869 [Rhizopus microsporus]